MTFLLYALTFIPMALITLVAHELGHLVAARLLRVKVSGFQIGIGRTLLSFYTGNTVLPLDPTSFPTNLTHQFPQPGQLATAYVTQDDLGRRYTVALLPLAHHHLQADAHNSIHRQYANSTMQLTGRVRRISNDQVVLADVAWTLRAIPFMAAVHLPEDNSQRIPNLFNTAPWRSQMLITLAGPIANILLFAAVILAMATIPLPAPQAPVLSVTNVEPNSPAHQAGFASR